MVSDVMCFLGSQELFWLHSGFVRSVVLELLLSGLLTLNARLYQSGGSGATSV